MKHIFIILLLIISISEISYSYELRLNFSRSYIYDDKLYVDVKTFYEDQIYQNIKKYIDNGIVVFINYRVDLIKKNLLFDDNIREIYLYRKLYYDFFTKEYVVLNSETMREIRNTDLEILIKNIYQINRIEVINVNKLNKNNKYLFKTRLSIQFQNAYPYLSVFFNIITPIQYRIKWLKSNEFSIKELYYNNM
ncbi:DUF4390 domain-containing protein [Brachyspira hyodysenteriae]|uniref:DUF4390 domain-containing protein n=2 Tax=Brachyspira hyodysenteriae TaxID=159 RepID=A0A3B6VAH7_BRAHW|nr:DUF4390 domain-containing protein [Brachyspira hyodysenteriae]ACN83820.1 hypothetical protein BHWA1_01342 [Brachyspira hyodysenteriae WA1]ANN64061.1 hypothetical protein BHYOB78_09340 [Brachyspira hyodysenteriae ATCC 27164]AUJ49548.1 hypothetical protein BH718_01103 [Brachyspira hyodysenteriae]KLI14423.1 hypothetical protein SU44_11500 [Brachyspira hyodysenteriae]KLI15181.1 hypothetical protein SU46_09890 [Brachyspira hyodysenteriae]